MHILSIIFFKHNGGRLGVQEEFADILDVILDDVGSATDLGRDGSWREQLDGIAQSGL